MILAYQYRLKPNKTQSKLLWKLLEIACRIYNTSLQEKIDYWNNTGKYLTYQEQALTLKEKREQDLELSMLNFSATQQVLRRLDKAYRRFFADLKSGKRVGKPRFKKPHRFRTLEFTYGDGVKIVSTNNNKIGLRIQNVGAIRVIWHRIIPSSAVVKRVYITSKADGWYATFSLDIPDDALVNKLPATENSIGIDVGVENLLALSNGEMIANPRWFRKTEGSIAEKQQILSKKQKGSKRWRRMRKQIAKLHLKIQRQRKDFYFKLSNRLVKEFDVVCVEDLNIKGMAQSNLSKSILDASWGLFLNQILPYKAWRAGKEVIRVNPKGTSQTCAVCNCPVPKDLSTRQHICPFCGFSTHRDTNSALLILKLGLEPANRSTSSTGCTVPVRS